MQIAYNTEHGIDPQPLRKKISDITAMLDREEADTASLMADSRMSGKVPDARRERRDTAAMPTEDLAALVKDLTEQMRAAAGELNFELAARLRDEVADLKKELRQMVEATK